MKKRNEIFVLTYKFSLGIMEFCEWFEVKHKDKITKQLLKLGISIGINVREAHDTKSKTDYLKKIEISAKEVEKTENLLLLCKHSNEYPFNEKLYNELINIKKRLSLLN